ncbi:hypothetical protein AUR64_00235 [Haloprofundus marisrubri]|uniref:Uncharacterized protein n=1 Tax=Haloprofundus marisrubri TaxID=1514971 RepID=A0A0W1RDX5_9EURY|nr:hypothetical protein [Haloprofundus marisrubri]KTG11655.1 hypothetical protein AUR64_00235 [Haloprofundus marisrubri]
MADLDSCYFCGEIGDGLTEFAVVPPRFDPTDEQQRTVVLCTTCRKKLGTVLEPIVDVLGGSDSEAPPPSPSPDAVSPSPSESPHSPPTSPNSPGADETTPTTEADEDADVIETDAGVESTPPPPGDAIDTTGFDDPLAADAAGITIDAPPTDAPPTDVDTPSTDAEPTPGASETTDDGEFDPDHDAPDVDTADTDSSAPTEEPAEFRTVMRLLSNREFPVDRAEIESLASGAYDLDDAEVRDILDYAIDRGVLAERNGQLHRG